MIASTPNVISDDALLALREEAIRQQPPTTERLLFLTVSGSHLYGFPSVDSDIDVRGVHLNSALAYLGLESSPDSLERKWSDGDVPVELVTHDIGKFIRLLLKPNGSVLEILTSPLVVHTTNTHALLKSFVPLVATSSHADHYKGFFLGEWKDIGKWGEGDVPVKKLLYAYRTLLTGLFLMHTGKVECFLPSLAELCGVSGLDELIAMKVSGERGMVPIGAHRDRLTQLVNRLLQAKASTVLPPRVDEETRRDLHRLLLDLRLSTLRR